MEESSAFFFAADQSFPRSVRVTGGMFYPAFEIKTLFETLLASIICTLSLIFERCDAYKA